MLSHPPRKKNAMCVRPNYKCSKTPPIINPPNQRPETQCLLTRFQKTTASGHVWTLTFPLGAEQPNQTNPKFPAPAVHADRSLHSTATKTCFFEPSTTTRLRPPAEDPEPIMKSAAPCCVWLLACPVLWNLFHPLGKLLRDRGRRGAWREAGTECVVPSSGPPNHLCSRLLGEMWPAGLPLVAPRPPLREWEAWRGQ